MSFVRKSGNIYSAYQKGTRLEVSWWQYDTNVGENRSDFRVLVRLFNQDYSSTLPTPYSVTIDGEEYTGEISDWSGYPYVQITSIDKIIEHEADGTKEVNISAWFDMQLPDFNPFTASGTAVLEPINDIPAIRQDILNILDTEVNVSWTSDRTICDVRYSVDGGDTWEYVGDPNFRLGNYMITGLEPETTYSIVTHVQSAENRKSSESTPKEVTTLPLHYFKVLLSLRTGTKTSATIRLTLKTADEDFTKYYPIRWRIYPYGYENNQVVVDDEFGMYKGNNTAKDRKFDGLLPEHDYIVSATLYEELPMIDSNKFETVSLHIRTSSMGGDFINTIRSASVISMELKNMPTLDCDTKAVLSYKKSSDSEWITKRTFEALANSEMAFTEMFTGLKSSTSYDFKVSLYKAGSPLMLIKEYTQTVSTIEYIPETEFPYPYFKKPIVVPHVGRGVILCGLSEPLKEGCRVVLYEIIDLDTDERIELTDMTKRGDEYFAVVGKVNTSSVIYFRVGIVDQYGNAHNISQERLEVYFPPVFHWSGEMDMCTQGEPVNLMASTVRELEGILCNSYDYTIYEETHDTPDIKEYYDALKVGISRVNEGELIKGGYDAVIHQAELMATAFLNFEPMNVPNSGDPITAHYLNVLGKHIYRVLDIIDS